MNDQKKKKEKQEAGHFPVMWSEGHLSKQWQI